MIEPTDSSMPPVMITKAWPMAKMPNSPTRLAVFPKLIAERKERIYHRHHRAHHEDQDEKAYVFLEHDARPLNECSRQPQAAARCAR